MEMTRQNTVSAERRSSRYPGNWNRYKAVIAWLVLEGEKNVRAWDRIPKAHAILHRCWESRMRQEGYH